MPVFAGFQRPSWHFWYAEAKALCVSVDDSDSE